MVSLRLNGLHLVAYGFYLLVAIIVTWPLVTVFSSHFIGHPFSDSYEYARFVWWFPYALRNGQPLFFQPWLAYPDGLTAWLLWSIPLQSFPAWLFALVLPLPAAMNLGVLLRLALNGWAMYVLVRRLTGQSAPALVSGVIFLAYPTFQGQLAAGHTGLLALWPVPLYVASLQSLVHRSQSSVLSTQHSVLSTFHSELGTRNSLNTPHSALSTQYSVLSVAFFFVLSALGSNQILIFMLLPVTAVFVLMLLFRRDWSALRRVMLALALGAALSLVFIVPGFVEALNAPPWLQERGDVTYSADLLSIVSPSFQHPLFGRLDYTHAVLGVDPFEKPAYVGLAAALLALIGVWKRRESRWWLVVAVIAWILSLGPLLKILDQPVSIVVDDYPTHIPLPWALYQQMPLLNIVRVPARFNFTIALAVAVMAGYGLSAFSRQSSVFPTRNTELGTRNFRLSTQYSVLSTLLLTAFILWEYQLFWTGMPTIPADVPQPIADLAQRDDVRAVLDVPWDHLLAAKQGLYLQTAHHKPLIAGQITRRTPVNPAKLAVLQDTLDPALLNAAGVDVIILHKEWDEAETEPLLRERLGNPFYEDDRFALFDTPETDVEPGFVAVPTPITEISSHADSYFYAPERGVVTVRVEQAGGGRLMVFRLDGETVGWSAYNHLPIELYLEVDAGYHTFTLAVEPPCPVIPHPALRCRSAQVSSVTITPR